MKKYIMPLLTSLYIITTPNVDELFKSKTMLGRALELQKNAQRILGETPAEIAARVIREGCEEAEEFRRQQVMKAKKEEKERKESLMKARETAIRNLEQKVNQGQTAPDQFQSLLLAQIAQQVSDACCGDVEI